MLAASGHTTISAELLHNKPSSAITNIKLIHQIIHAESLKNITIISADESSAQIILDLLKSLSSKTITKNDEKKEENLRHLIDGILLTYTNNNWHQVEKWQLAEVDSTEQKQIAPTLFINTIPSQPDNIPNENLAIKFLNTNKNVQLKTVDSKEAERFQVMQIFANFLDFIHPR